MTALQKLFIQRVIFLFESKPPYGQVRTLHGSHTYMFVCGDHPYVPRVLCSPLCMEPGEGTYVPRCSPKGSLGLGLGLNKPRNIGPGEHRYNPGVCELVKRRQTDKCSLHPFILYNQSSWNDWVGVRRHGLIVFRQIVWYHLHRV